MLVTSLAGNSELRGKRRTRIQGLVLIELLITLVILAFAAAAVAPNIQSSIDTARYNATVRSVLATLRAARAHSLDLQREVVVEFDTNSRTYAVPGHVVRSIEPKDAVLRLTVAEQELSRRVAGIRFYPDGSATGGRVEIDLKGHSSAIDVDWLTGLAVLLD